MHQREKKGNLICLKNISTVQVSKLLSIFFCFKTFFKPLCNSTDGMRTMYQLVGTIAELLALEQELTKTIQLHN